MAQPNMLSIFQPWFVGRYYMANFATAQGTNAWSNTQCIVSPMLLMDNYRFDQAALSISVTSATYTFRIGVYQLDRTTFLPSKLIEEYGTLSASTATPTFSLSPSRTYRGLIGLAVQAEGTGSPPTSRNDQGGLFQMPVGWSAPFDSAPTVPYAYKLISSDGLVNGALPATSLFSLTKLQAAGSGLILRRAT